MSEFEDCYNEISDEFNEVKIRSDRADAIMRGLIWVENDDNWKIGLTLSIDGQHFHFTDVEMVMKIRDMHRGMVEGQAKRFCAEWKRIKERRRKKCQN